MFSKIEPSGGKQVHVINPHILERENYMAMRKEQDLQTRLKTTRKQTIKTADENESLKP